MLMRSVDGALQSGLCLWRPDTELHVYEFTDLQNKDFK